jgi:hypothetical protein
MKPSEFESFARPYVERYFEASLSKKSLPPTKEWDYVSPDEKIVGDAKYLTYRGNASAEKSVISEHVWLLEKLLATTKFLLFGGQLQTPLDWLRRWRSLLPTNVRFFALEENEFLILWDPDEKFNQAFEEMVDSHGRWKRDT